MVDHNRLKGLKHRLFKRDGWYEAELGAWFAYCAFPGCRMILWYETATLDHYPIPLRLGGLWSMKNLRLACAPCNNGHGGAEAGSMSAIMPIGLSKEEKRAWWQQYALEGDTS